VLFRVPSFLEVFPSSRKFECKPGKNLGKPTVQVFYEFVHKMQDSHGCRMAMHSSEAQLRSFQEVVQDTRDQYFASDGVVSDPGCL
jgi:hypothetical protein